ncbi:MAG: DUF3332 domain-containing protein [Tannerellaceae bacterium]|nr:DUF3332 domain-containing protein [Tannerellaceae bacterium]
MTTSPKVYIFAGVNLYYQSHEEKSVSYTNNNSTCLFFFLFTSCIGSFGLTTKLHSWNKEIDNKFVNELVFVTFLIVPVYPVAVIADLLVINSIEFWKGENPVLASHDAQTIETENGIYLVKTETNGYSITKEGEGISLQLLFNEQENSWALEYNRYEQLLFKYTKGNEVVMYLPNGQEIEVSLTPEGVATFKDALLPYGYYAGR